jgi:hypothetical protein
VKQVFQRCLVLQVGARGIERDGFISLTVRAAHHEVFFAESNSILATSSQLFCQLPTLKTRSILHNPRLTWKSRTWLTLLNWTLLYNYFAWTKLNISFPTIPLLLCVHQSVAWKQVLLFMYDLRFSWRWLWRKQCSGIRRPVDIVLTDVSEEPIASIFRVEEKRRKSASEDPVWAGTNRLICLLTNLLVPAHAGSSLADFLFSSTLKMEAIHFSETSVNTISTRCHIPEDCFLQVLLLLHAYSLLWECVYSPVP